MATVFAVKASAGRGEFSLSVISENPLAIRAGIPAAAEKGRANRELVFQLERVLGCRVELVAGATSRRKTLAADCSPDEIVRKINEQNQR